MTGFSVQLLVSSAKWRGRFGRTASRGVVWVLWLYFKVQKLFRDVPWLLSFCSLLSLVLVHTFVALHASRLGQSDLWAAAHCAADAGVLPVRLAHLGFFSAAVFGARIVLSALLSPLWFLASGRFLFPSAWAGVFVTPLREWLPDAVAGFWPPLVRAGFTRGGWEAALYGSSAPQAGGSLFEAAGCVAFESLPVPDSFLALGGQLLLLRLGGSFFVHARTFSPRLAFWAVFFPAAAGRVVSHYASSRASYLVVSAFKLLPLAAGLAVQREGAGGEMWGVGPASIPAAFAGLAAMEWVLFRYVRLWSVGADPLADLVTLYRVARDARQFFMDRGAGQTPQQQSHQQQSVQQHHQQHHQQQQQQQYHHQQQLHQYAQLHPRQQQHRVPPPFQPPLRRASVDQPSSVAANTQAELSRLMTLYRTHPHLLERLSATARSKVLDILSQSG